MSYPTFSEISTGLTWMDHQEALNLLYQHEVLNHKLIWACARNHDLEAYALPDRQGCLLWDPRHQHMRVSVLGEHAQFPASFLQEAALLEGPECAMQKIVEAHPNENSSSRTSLIYTLENQDLQMDREFRRLRPDDVEVVNWLIQFNAETRGRTLTRAEVLKMLYASYREFYILEHRQKCAAVAAVNRWTLHYQSVSFVYVPPESRGKGFGRRLMASLSAFILQERKKNALLFADPDNAVANVLYQSLGYQVAGKHVSVLAGGQGQDAERRGPSAEHQLL
ncbi:GNAT family N-acetyltransferase [Deinococcus roseus]|uniref:N-acetyltransferase domain-containing protein n=1 Tax=Deinococcus roseus TaxID=392414 RepID=A0ABQ2CWC8_9DEIO|nr:GNAT family N-acetyltransferase [Deinococcus roseus]GGJ20487.1 hypothetical protein GCM10008938_03460 [Deinococcus roseus]